MFGLSVEAVSALFSALSTFLVLIGVAFALVELRQSNLARRQAAAIGIVQTIQTQEVRRALRRVLDLPIDAPPHLVRSDPDMLAAALAVDSVCEMWGSMVFEGVIDHRTLDRMVGGAVGGTWRRLHVWVRSEREITGVANLGEWWEWLNDLLVEDGDPGKHVGAHVSYRDRVAINRPRRARHIPHD